MMYGVNGRNGYVRGIEHKKGYRSKKAGCTTKNFMEEEEHGSLMNFTERCSIALFHEFSNQKEVNW